MNLQQLFVVDLSTYYEFRDKNKDVTAEMRGENCLKLHRTHVQFNVKFKQPGW
jgi:hypothetical protein